MTPKLLRAADVCEMAQLQPYVLRSWEKEFPGIGVQKSSDSQRLYRESDVEQVLRIKQLVFGEGLTLAGARRRLEDGTTTAAPALPSLPLLADEPLPSVPPAAHASPVVARRVADGAESEVIEALGDDARTRIAYVREGLESILAMLSEKPGTTLVVVDGTPANGTPANGKEAAAAVGAPARATRAREKASPVRTKRASA